MLFPKAQGFSFSEVIDNVISLLVSQVGGLFVQVHGGAASDLHLASTAEARVCPSPELLAVDLRFLPSQRP